jgi:hypothetical protein
MCPGGCKHVGQLRTYVGGSRKCGNMADTVHGLVQVVYSVVQADNAWDVGDKCVDMAEHSHGLV